MRLAGERDDRSEAARMIADRTHSECVGTIGRMAIFYRQQRDPVRRRVELPG